MARRTFELPAPALGKLIDFKSGKAVNTPTIPLICERIHHYRELAGIKQKNFAQRIGVTERTVSNWENGRSRPDVDLVPSICEALNITMYELFDMEDPSMQLNAGEQMHIASYRQLSLGYKYAVDNLVESLINVQISMSCPEL